MILSFVPNHSGKGEEFIRSTKQDEFQDFYVWFPANYSQKPADERPNNWVSLIISSKIYLSSLFNHNNYSMLFRS